MALVLPARPGLKPFLDGYSVPAETIRDSAAYVEHPAAWLDASWADGASTRFRAWEWGKPLLTYGFSHGHDPNAAARGVDLHPVGDPWIEDVWARAIEQATASLGLTLTRAVNGTVPDLAIGLFSARGSSAGMPAGYAYLPPFARDSTIPAEAGDIFLRRDFVTERGAASDDVISVLVHELGHALGLKHPFGKDKDPAGDAPPHAPDPFDSYDWTIMSYARHPRLFFPEFEFTPSSSAPGTSQYDVRVARWDAIFRQDFGVLDLLALQTLYGAFAPPADVVRPAIFAPVRVPGDKPFYRTLAQRDAWEADGWLDASAVTGTTLIDLRPGQLSDLRIDWRRHIEDAFAEWWAANRPQGFAGPTPTLSPASVDRAVEFIVKDARSWNGERALGIAVGTVFDKLIATDQPDTVILNRAPNTAMLGGGNDLVFVDVSASNDDVVDGGPGIDAVLLSATSAVRPSGIETVAVGDGQTIVGVVGETVLNLSAEGAAPSLGSRDAAPFAPGPSLSTTVRPVLDPAGWPILAWSERSSGTSGEATLRDVELAIDVGTRTAFVFGSVPAGQHRIGGQGELVVTVPFALSAGPHGYFVASLFERPDGFELMPSRFVALAPPPTTIVSEEPFPATIGVAPPAPILV